MGQGPGLGAVVTWPQEGKVYPTGLLYATHTLGLSPPPWSGLSGLSRLLARVEQQIWTELLQKVGQAPQRINDQSSEARSRQMCFYRPLNETNEWWGPWPLREAEGGGVEKQLPRVSPEAPASMPSQLQWRPRQEGLGQLP